MNSQRYSCAQMSGSSTPARSSSRSTGSPWALAVEVDGQPLGLGVDDGDLVLGIGGVFEPEVGELVAHAFGGGDDAEELLAVEGVGDGGVDGGPDVPGLLVDGELVEDEVGGVAAGGVGVRGDGEDAGLVGEGDLGAGHEGLALPELVVSLHGQANSLGPLAGLAHPFDGLALAGGEHHPQRAGV